MVRGRHAELSPPARTRSTMRTRVLGNRAALLRAGVPSSEADEAAGGDLYRDHLPAPAAASPREMVAKVHSPSTCGLDFFLMGKKKDPKGFEGFLLLLQPLSCFVSAARIGKRSSRVSASALRDLAISDALRPLPVVRDGIRSSQEARRGPVRSHPSAGDRPGHGLHEDFPETPRGKRRSPATRVELQQDQRDRENGRALQAPPRHARSGARAAVAQGAGRGRRLLERHLRVQAVSKSPQPLQRRQLRRASGGALRARADGGARALPGGARLHGGGAERDLRVQTGRHRARLDAHHLEANGRAGKPRSGDRTPTDN